MVGMLLVAVGVGGKVQDCGSPPTRNRRPNVAGRVGTQRRKLRGTVLALLGALLVITSFTLAGHTSTTPHRARRGRVDNLCTCW